MKGDPQETEGQVLHRAGNGFRRGMHQRSQRMDQEGEPRRQDHTGSQEKSHRVPGNPGGLFPFAAAHCLGNGHGGPHGQAHQHHRHHMHHLAADGYGGNAGRPFDSQRPASTRA